MKSNTRTAAIGRWYPLVILFSLSAFTLSWIAFVSIGILFLLRPIQRHEREEPKLGIVIPKEKWTALKDVSCGATLTLLRIWNTNRIILVCVNNDKTMNVRLGDATVTATKGLQLKPGTSFGFTGMSSIYCISEGAGVTVSCMEKTPL